MAGLYCVEDTGVVEDINFNRYFRLLGPVSSGPEGDYQSPGGELLCAVCCR